MYIHNSETDMSLGMLGEDLISMAASGSINTSHRLRIVGLGQLSLKIPEQVYESLSFVQTIARMLYVA